MAETPEHEFLKGHFNHVLQEFSNLKLYGYTESDRKKFDLSCLLERDWSRPLAGQVLWRHSRGLDKDLRTLLTDLTSEIKVYLASDTVLHHAKFEDAISDYKRSGRFEDLFRLKAIWVPSDFDADKEEQRLLVGELVKSQVVDDILFNVVFGKLTAEDIAFFLTVSGIQGVNLAILHTIATEGFFNIAGLSKRLGISPGPIREKLAILSGTGFITRSIGALTFDDTAKGRVFLDLLSRLMQEYEFATMSEELVYILTRLDCAPAPKSEVDENREVFPKSLFINLIQTVRAAGRQWSIDFKNIDYSRKIVLTRPS